MHVRVSPYVTRASALCLCHRVSLVRLSPFVACADVTLLWRVRMSPCVACAHVTLSLVRTSPCVAGAHVTLRPWCACVCVCE